nr:ParB N-terminal domain-containing protein [Methanobrevibacter arboriphilus]
MNFIQDYEVAKLKTADYNPRKILDKSFITLKKSLKTFGCCKPLIINIDNTLVAGHQRTKALKELGFKKAPVYILKKKASLSDEIRFNLIHNSVETETSKTKICQNIPLHEFSIIYPKNIQIIKSGSANVIKEIGKLINKYGEFGSAIINENGKVIHNNDYVYLSKLLNKPLIAYKLSNEEIDIFKRYMSIDYGEYCYDNLNIKSYNQTYCQMYKNMISSEEILIRKSSLYEKYVLKDIKKEDKIIDFGAGQLGYYNSLKKLGYNISCYEPFYRGNGKDNLLINNVIEMINNIEKKINKQGLYDTCILDSVINSIVNNDFEHHVLTSCNALLNKEGKLYVNTRNKDNSTLDINKSKKARFSERKIQFLDENNRSAIFRNGVWTLQKFHNRKSFNKLLKKYFKKVSNPTKSKTNGMVYAICQYPKKLDKKMIEESLNIEFNMEYPNGYYHNQHQDLVEKILQYH